LFAARGGQTVRKARSAWSHAADLILRKEVNDDLTQIDLETLRMICSMLHCTDSARERW
jgi:hypothetical protein